MKKILLVAFSSIILGLPCMAQDEFGISEMISNGEFSVPEAIPAMRITSLSDVVSKRPALPTAKDLLSPEAKEAFARKDVLAYEQGAQAFHFNLMEERTRLQQKHLELGNQQRQQQNRQQAAMQQASSQGLMPSQQEIMQAMMSSGLDLETASEEEMMNVVADMYAKKWNIPQSDARIFMGMAMTNPQQAENFLKQKHPQLYNKLEQNAPKASDFIQEDPNKAAYDKLHDQLFDLTEEVSNLKITMSMRTGLPTDKMEEIYNATTSGWSKSAEYAKVVQIEAGLAQRIDKWDYWTNAKDGQTIYYPQWWVDGRKQENAQIDAWNKRQAEKWLAEMNAWDGKMRSIAQRLVALDNQIEQLRGNGEMTFEYTSAKLQVYAVETYLLDYYNACSTALRFPNVLRQEESHSFVYWLKG